MDVSFCGDNSKVTNPHSPAVVNYILVHASYTSSAANIGAREIRRWHRERGFEDIGYNYVIKRDGTREEGRSGNYSGAHTLGIYNDKSLAICLVGGKAKGRDDWEFNFTANQIVELMKLIEEIKKEWPSAKVLGHRDADKSRKCPGFDVKSMFSDESISQWNIYQL